MTQARLLDSLTTLDAEELRDAVLLVPLGATEQHGPHLPLGTDTTIAVAWCEQLATRLGRCVVAPPLPFGSSGEHQSFAGTISIGQAALTAVLIELTRSASMSFGGVVFVSGHAGNASVLNTVVSQMRYEGHLVTALVPSFEGADAHAGETETSLMLAIDPDAVDMASAVAGCVAPLADLIDTMRRGGVAAVSTNGILGDPTTASVENGERLLAQLGEQASVITNQFAAAPVG